jgi:hypothetical protein
LIRSLFKPTLSHSRSRYIQDIEPLFIRVGEVILEWIFGFIEDLKRISLLLGISHNILLG